MKPVLHDPEGQSDIFAAVRFYEGRHQGLGEQFLRAVERTVRRIAERPESFAYYEVPVRSCRVPKFPYRVLYVNDSEAIWIIALAHLSRMPGWWRYRLNR